VKDGPTSNSVSTALLTLTELIVGRVSQMVIMSNFISSASDRKKLNNYTISLQHNETKSIDRLSYIYFKPYMSNNVNINGSTDRTRFKCHKIYTENRESLNKRLLPLVIIQDYVASDHFERLIWLMNEKRAWCVEFDDDDGVIQTKWYDVTAVAC